MTDSSEIDECVVAVIELLKKKEFAKIKECGEAIADAASEEEPWFEPEQIMQMMNVWLDACILKVDLEALEITGRCLRWAKVEDDSAHPGMPVVLRKVARALDTPGAEHLDNMLLVRMQPAKVTGDLELYEALGALLQHPRGDLIHDALATICGRLMNITDLPDEEVAELFAMTVDLLRHVSSELPGHKPGDMESSKRLSRKLLYLNRLVGAAHIFCSMLVLNPSAWPKATAVIAVPTLVMALTTALEAVKPKPKEQELQQEVKALVEACQGLLGCMPKPAAGSSSDPVADARAYVKALQEVKDADSLNGTMNMMMGTTDTSALDVVLAATSLEAVVKAFDRVKKETHSQAWQTLPKFLAWAAEAQPGALDLVADKLADIIVAGPTVMIQPKALVDALTEHSPATARKLWARLPKWKEAIQREKGSAMYEAVLYAVISALEGMPRVLEGDELGDFCRRAAELAQQAKGSQMEDAVKCTVLTGLKSVVAKDKSKIPEDVLDWVRAVKGGDGHARDAAVGFMDAYEGRSLEGAYGQIAEANERFAKACGDLEGLKSYVDENVADLKDFVGTVVKKLPLPSKFSSEPRYVAKMAMLLHFECQAEPKTRLCALPEGTFTTETLEWNRWLKLGLSAAKLGKSVLSGDCLGDVPGTVDQVKEMYKTYSKKDDAAFLKYISEPFLTSEEQDQLLGQLRKAGYFKKFAYDAQTGKWLCANCHLVHRRAGRARTPESLEAACKAAESDGAMPVLLGGEGVARKASGLQERATNVKDVAIEVKKTSFACCDFFGLCARQEAEVVEGLSSTE